MSNAPVLDMREAGAQPDRPTHDTPPGDARPRDPESPRQRLRREIQAEVARAGPKPAARSTLELIAESSVRAVQEDGVTVFRVVDETGAVRTGPDGSGTPLTIGGLLEELRVKHPSLFEGPRAEAAPPAPVAAPERMTRLTERSDPAPSPVIPHHALPSDAVTRPAGAPAPEARAAGPGATGPSVGAGTGATRDWLLIDAGDRGPARTDGGRAQDGRAQDGRTQDGPTRDGLDPARRPGPAHAVRRLWDRAASGLRARFGPSLATVATVARTLRERRPAEARPAPVVRDGAGGLAPQVARGWGPGREFLARLRTHGAVLAPRGGHHGRRWPWALGALALLVGGGALLASLGPGESGGARDPGATGTLSPPAPPALGAVRAVPEVIDTATLKLDGKVVRLFGVEWARGGNPEDLGSYIRGREVLCRPQEGTDRHRCTVEGHDLSRVVIFNGGGRASPGATQELLDAEKHAKAESLGVWRKTP